MDPFLEIMGVRRMSIEEGFTFATDKDPTVIRILCNKEKLLSHHDKFFNYKRKNETYHINIQYTKAPPPLNINVAVELIRENQVTISSMINSVDQVLRGKFLLCRTIAPPMKFTALITVADDPEGELGVRVAFYNYVPSVATTTTLAQYNEILPVGTILAIKNPLLKQANDGGVGVHIGNPTDVIIMDDEALQKLNPDLKWLGEIPPNYAKFMKKPNKSEKSANADNKSWEDWKKLGNGHFATQEYTKAVEAYTSGLQMEPGNAFLLGNRALALLGLEEFDLALSDAEEILKNSPTNVKGIALKAKSMWGLKKFEGAKYFLTKKIRQRELRNDKDIQEFHKEAEMLFEQATLGEYPAEIHCEFLMSEYKSEPLDWAEYEGDVIIKDTPDGRGRGLYATKDIAPGQLILASKAIGFIPSFKKTLLLASAAGSSSELCRTSLDDICNTLLVLELARVLKINPQKGNSLYKLSAGPEMKYLDSENGLNGDDCSIIDKKRIASICGHNSFRQLIPNSDKSLGLWFMPSFINRSCIDSNSFWMMYGDFLFIRAFKEVKAGEEITISYMSPTQSYAERNIFCNKYGFQCNCQLCEFDRQEPEAIAEEQVGILNKLNSLETVQSEDYGLVYTNDSIRQIQQLFEQFMKIRPKYQLALSPIIEKLPFCINKDNNNAVKYFKIQYEILKDTSLRASLMTTAFGILYCFMEEKKKKEAQGWIPMVKNAAITAHGNLEVLRKNPNLKFWQVCGLRV